MTKFFSSNCIQLVMLVMLLNSITTSNMTGCHGGPKWKLQAGYRASSLQRSSYLWVPLLLSMGC